MSSLLILTTSNATASNRQRHERLQIWYECTQIRKRRTRTATARKHFPSLSLREQRSDREERREYLQFCLLAGAREAWLAIKYCPFPHTHTHTQKSRERNNRPLLEFVFAENHEQGY